MLSIQINKPLQTANLARLTSLWKEQFRTKPKNLTKTRTDNEKIQTKLQKALKLADKSPGKFGNWEWTCSFRDTSPDPRVEGAECVAAPTNNI